VLKQTAHQYNDSEIATLSPSHVSVKLIFTELIRQQVRRTTLINSRRAK